MASTSASRGTASLVAVLRASEFDATHVTAATAAVPSHEA